MAKAVPYKNQNDPDRWFRINVEDKRGRGTHATYEFIVCKVCGLKYRPGTYAAHKKRPEHTSKMTGHRPKPAAKPKLRARPGG